MEIMEINTGCSDKLIQTRHVFELFAGNCFKNILPIFPIFSFAIMN